MAMCQLFSNMSTVSIVDRFAKFFRCCKGR